MRKTGIFIVVGFLLSLSTLIVAVLLYLQAIGVGVEVPKKIELAPKEVATTPTVEIKEEILPSKTVEEELKTPPPPKKVEVVEEVAKAPVVVEEREPVEIPPLETPPVEVEEEVEQVVVPEEEKEVIKVPSAVEGRTAVEYHEKERKVVPPRSREITPHPYYSDVKQAPAPPPVVPSTLSLLPVRWPQSITPIWSEVLYGEGPTEYVDPFTFAKRALERRRKATEEIYNNLLWDL